MNDAIKGNASSKIPLLNKLTDQSGDQLKKEERFEDSTKKKVQISGESDEYFDNHFLYWLVENSYIKLKTLFPSRLRIDYLDFHIKSREFLIDIWTKIEENVPSSLDTVRDQFEELAGVLEVTDRTERQFQ